MKTSRKIIAELKSIASPAKAKILASFFKTGPGQYGAGDVFWGITVPDERLIARKYREVELETVRELLLSAIHEVRLTGLLILTYQKKLFPARAREYFDFYLRHLDRINNWDLVDVTCPVLVGDYLVTQPRAREVLSKLATSKNMWSRRVAIVSTWAFIRAGRFAETLFLAEKLLTDREDLLHKATGWMLREVGKRDEKVLRVFLDAHASAMPRVMLRYAIEKFSPADRRYYLNLSNR